MKKNIVVLGVPFDSNSSYKKGSALAPVKIKEALFCDSSNLWTEDLIDLGTLSGWEIRLDIEVLDEKSAFNTDFRTNFKRQNHIRILASIQT